jgi:hypothetical protein
MKKTERRKAAKAMIARINQFLARKSSRVSF